MQRYEAYKDSGVEWIGEIPEGWNVRRVKSLATGGQSLFLDGDWIESDVIENEGIRYLTTGNVGEGRYKDQGSGFISEQTFKELSCLKVLPGDLIISRLNEPLGRACLAPDNFDEYVVAVDIVVLRGDCFSSRFLVYAMNEQHYAETLSMMSRGSTMKRVSRTILGDMTLAFPPLSEQRAIADYLDAKTAAIDALIVDCEREVELLQEYRKAVISEAVTKGLDPNAPMKDSGIEWIGAIPQHWDAGKILRHARLESGHTPSRLHPEWWTEGECTIPWVTTQDVHRFRDGRITSIVDTELHVSQIGLDNSSARLLPAGTVALSRTASVGFSIVLERPSASSQDYADWIPDDLLDSFYLLYSLRSMDMVFKQLQMGSTHKTIYMPDIMKLAIAFPPIDEQRAIVAHLDAKTAEIDALVDAKQQMADKLREYRKSLISEAVTGKFRVPSVSL